MFMNEAKGTIKKVVFITWWHICWSNIRQYPYCNFKAI